MAGTRFSNGIKVAASGLYIGAAGSEVAVTPSAADLNKTLGLAAGLAIPGSRFTVQYPQVAAADVAKTFFVAPAACKMVLAYERHVTVAGQAGTLQIEKLTSGTAIGSGDLTLATAFDLTSTTNVPVTKAAVTTALATLAAGDALCLKLASGAATSYALGTITVLMEWV